MSDDQIVDMIANIWIEEGGDSDGFWFLSNNISARIDELRSNSCN